MPNASYYRAQNLQAMINKLGWTQKRVALQLGISEGTLRKWLSGTAPVVPPMVIFAMRYIIEVHPDGSHGTARTTKSKTARTA